MKRFGFIGLGNMGTAILNGAVASGVIKKSQVIAFDHDSRKARRLGVKNGRSEADVVLKSDVVLLCVKPKDMQAVLDNIGAVGSRKIIASVAAGITTSRLEKNLG